MSEFTKHKSGTFSWSDLGAADAAVAKKFYTEIFDWGVVEMPMGPDEMYTMFTKNGKTVAAMYQQNADQRAQGMPSMWSTYVSVDDVEAVTAKATALGATVMMPPGDVFGAGRMSMLQDPTGAMFALWQAQGHIGAQMKEEPGSLAWFELRTGDTAKAKAFYTSLFNWGVSTMPAGPDQEYTMFQSEDIPIGGMMALEAGGPPSPIWTPYFAVANAAESVTKAVSLGATVIIPATAIPNMGHFAILNDPQGAALYLYDSLK